MAANHERAVPVQHAPVHAPACTPRPCSGPPHRPRRRGARRTRGVNTDGVVDYVTRLVLGVRTSTGLYRFIHGLGGTVAIEHRDFAPSEEGAEQRRTLAGMAGQS